MGHRGQTRHASASCSMERIVAGMLVLVGLGVLGCATDVQPEASLPAYVSHLEGTDFAVSAVSDDAGKADGVTSSFAPNALMSDSFFVDSHYVDATTVQRFLEASPYSKRSWLADAEFDGIGFAELLVAISYEYGLNPILLLARMQVERGLVSMSNAPSSASLDRAFGCGCYDNASCDARYRGFRRQLACAATTLRNRFDDSVSGNGQWVAGLVSETVDGIDVSPANHATAALYAYTPWVLEGQGGNWLVWNITRRYERHFVQLGVAAYAQDSPLEPWVGAACERDADCGFSHGGAAGFCLRLSEDLAAPGFCSMPCEGYCRDRAGHAETFCAALANAAVGVCVSKSKSANQSCATVPGTLPTWVSRFVGMSAAPEVSALVCVP